ncbi:hypothetical protein [Pseudomonas oryzihabitans]|uniref:hypothetical protein n=1 Tax=Pseudomonas oryzihabitans TaxID=47885 RepID=UPI0005A5E499|nr:hypothetical protein [Pseudomonas oryzihabitans]
MKLQAELFDRNYQADAVSTAVLVDGFDRLSERLIAAHPSRIRDQACLLRFFAVHEQRQVMPLPVRRFLPINQLLDLRVGFLAVRAFRVAVLRES